nr:hypothetical protein [uncultured Brevundimonas sp.]
MAILGGILAVVAMFVTFSLQSAHRDQTGVWGPSRSQMRNIRRQARKRGVSEHQAYDDWLARKQRALVTPVTTAQPVQPPFPRRGNTKAGIGRGVVILAVLAGLGWLLWRPTNEATFEPARAALVDRDRINCRATASTDAEIVKKLSRNDYLVIVDEQKRMVADRCAFLLGPE